jgi:beta-lysine 5,6-aminomutase beta subunit
VVTQRNIHIQHLTELMELLYAENLRDDLLVIVGGPRITHELALELGYDAGFGSGTTPSEVANFIVQELLKKRGL